MPYIQTPDQTRLFYSDGGSGKPIVFIASAWLDSRMWEFQIPYLVDRGFRCIAYDRRGHGRSDWPWDGYDYDTLADDLATLLEHLNLRDVTLVSHSAGAGEIVRYLARHGAARVARMAIVSGTTPCLMKRADNLEGIDTELMQADLATRTADRPKWFADHAGGFLGAGLQAIHVSPQLTEFVIRQCLECSARATVQFFLTGFTSDLRDQLRAIHVPALIVHGDHDIQAPLELCGRKTAQLVQRSTLLVYENAAHGLFLTHADRLNADLLAFAEVPQARAAASPASVRTAVECERSSR
jgi:non-heme chloroperoxidase